MDDYSADELRDARRPIASLISKSEKARQKLAPGSWQYAMLRDNLQALRVAVALMNREARGTDSLARNELQEALRALTSMVGRTEKAQVKCSPDTSQHTLLRNRLKALRIAEALVQAELDRS